MTFMIYYYIQNNYTIPVDPFGFGSEISNKKKMKEDRKLDIISAQAQL